MRDRAGKEASPVMDEVLGGRKLVYSTTNFIKYPLEEALFRIAAGGFRNVELWGNIKHLDPRSTETDVGRVKRLSERLRLNVVSVHAPFTLDLTLGPAERMKTWEELVERSMEQGELLGVKVVVVHPLTAGEDNSLEDYRSIALRTQDSLVRLADRAAARGQKLAIENMPAHRMRRYGRDVGELYDFVVSSGRDNLGLCLDTGHVVFNRGDAVEQFSRYCDRIISVHMNDNIWGMHMDLHLVPGSGSVDWQAFRLALGSGCFDGMIVLELDSRGRPSSIFGEALEFVNRYFGD